MFQKALSVLTCPHCETKSLSMEPTDTFDAYKDIRVFVLDDIDKIIDGCIAEFLVFRCVTCGAKERYSFRELERKVREEISKRVFTYLAQQDFISKYNPKDRVYVYCNKCNGFDGKGSCPQGIYNACELKRFPSGL